MRDGDTLNLVLWGAQGLLALFFLFAGIPKIFGRGIERWIGFSDLSRPLVVFIGLAEVLGAAGLALPMAAGALTWLTPLAAVGLALIVLLATGFHLRADERLQAVETALWAALAGVVAVGRWELALTQIQLPGWLLVGSVIVIVPSLILNIVVLLRRPVAAPRLGKAEA
jgi:hypothetical protein